MSQKLSWWDTLLRGTPVEYLHHATGEWRTAVVDAFRARDNAYVLITQNGTDVAGIDDVRERNAS